MSQRNRATSHVRNAQTDRWESRYYTKGSAASTKRVAKREMRKARRKLDAVEVEEGSEGSR